MKVVYLFPPENTHFLINKHSELILIIGLFAGMYTMRLLDNSTAGGGGGAVGGGGAGDADGSSDSAVSSMGSERAWGTEPSTSNSYLDYW